jgi:hypothetical protein
LVGTLVAEGAPEPIMALAKRAVEDETRQAVQCETVARLYGWELPLGEGPPHTPSGLASLAPLDRTLLPEMIPALGAEVLHGSVRPRNDRVALRAHGELGRPERATLLETVMRQVVLPGMAREGIEIRAALQALDRLGADKTRPSVREARDGDPTPVGVVDLLSARH